MIVKVRFASISYKNNYKTIQYIMLSMHYYLLLHNKDTSYHENQQYFAWGST